MADHLFNAHHSPIGAFSSFTLGFPGASGGLGLELGKPADQNVYIGIEESGSQFRFLPFYKNAASSEAERFTTGGADGDAPGIRIGSFVADEVTREFSVAIDTWHAGDLSFSIYSPIQKIPDPETAQDDVLRTVLVPALICELTVDNRAGKNDRRAVFGFSGSDPYASIRTMDTQLPDGYCGIGQGRVLAIVTDEAGVKSGQGFSIQDILESTDDNLWFGLGTTAALLMQVEAGQKRTFRFAACFYRGGIATSGIDCTYYYTRLFDNIEAVGTYALSIADPLKLAATESNTIVDHAHLSGDQQFMLAHAIRSYYGSTELLDHAGKPLWVVNEGEYRMINTFDLTVDHLFFELQMNPWVVRNVLDQFVDRYSYFDQVRFPGDSTLYPGGISFTHDMGIANVFSRPQHSCYEKSGIHGCFSHMTHEQLVNWICCAASYAAFTSDNKWQSEHLDVFEACLTSLLNRDHPNPSQRNGLMSLDSSRTDGGSEITTYDSLDASLGQARNNVYIAVKAWAACVLLNKLFTAVNRPELAVAASEQAARVAATIVASVGEDGTIPAVIGENVDARIIPAVEGLIFPFFLGYKKETSTSGPYGEMISALRTHIEKILNYDICLFKDDGWKLSSTSDNSWLSKIYLCQYVVRNVLGFNSPNVTQLADAAHVRWLLDPELSYHAWSDQMIAGRAMGSLYYPRGVTAVLWITGY